MDYECMKIDFRLKIDSWKVFSLSHCITKLFLPQDVKVFSFQKKVYVSIKNWFHFISVPFSRMIQILSVDY